ncbi:MAG: histidinol-phosphatase [Pseudomonadota bacterium]
MSDIAGFLHQLCDAAAKETLPRFRSGTHIENKLQSDFDPVTEGDREAERVIRALIEEHYPDHGIVGEEFGTVRADAKFKWVIDPIDGTRAFISGIPVWGTLIGLYEHGVPTAGIVHQPYTGERYFAVDGASWAKRDGEETRQPISTKSSEDISQAVIMTTTPALFNETERPCFDGLAEACRLERYGCDCYAYAMVAAGNADLVVETGLHIYDIAALIPIIEGAGGIVTSWSGGDASNGGQVLAAANKALHEAALAHLKPAAV